MHLSALLDFQFILLFYVWVVCLLPITDGYTTARQSEAGATRTYAWNGQSILLLIVGILAFIAWIVFLVTQVF